MHFSQTADRNNKYSKMGQHKRPTYSYRIKKIISLQSKLFLTSKYQQLQYNVILQKFPTASFT